MSKHWKRSELIQKESEESPLSKPKKNRSPNKENECARRSTKNNEFSISLNKIPTSLHANWDTRLFKIDLNKMQRQWNEQKQNNLNESIKCGSQISDVANLNPLYPIENNFETFNQEQKVNYQKVEESIEDVFVQDLFDVESNHSKGKILNNISKLFCEEFTYYFLLINKLY